MASYLAKHIDDDLWQQVKARAEKEGHPLRWIFTQLWTYYASHGLPRSWADTDEPPDFTLAKRLIEEKGNPIPDGNIIK